MQQPPNVTRQQRQELAVVVEQLVAVIVYALHARMKQQREMGEDHHVLGGGRRAKLVL